MRDTQALRLLGGVFLGGMAGAGLRMALPELSVGLPDGPGSSSLLANALACLLIGALHAGRAHLPSWAPAFGMVGFCGGLSTFSAFAVDLTVGLAAGKILWVVGSALFEIALGLALAWVGSRVVRRFTGGTTA